MKPRDLQLGSSACALELLVLLSLLKPEIFFKVKLVPTSRSRMCVHMLSEVITSGESFEAFRVLALERFLFLMNRLVVSFQVF